MRNNDIYRIRPEHTHEGGLQICDDGSDGTVQKLGFFGAAPTIQRTGAAQANVATAEIANAAGETQTAAEYNAAIAQINALTVLVNELRDALVEKGLIKGSA